jgi:hypothetical protein
MESALTALRERADRRLGAQLAEAQMEVNRAGQQYEKGANEQAKNSAEEAIARVYDQAIRQNESGRQSSAERMSTLAETLFNMNLSKELMQPGAEAGDQARQDLERAEEMIAEARHQGRQPAEVLAETIGQLKELEQELKEFQSGKDGQPGREVNRLADQIRLAAQDVAKSAGGPTGNGGLGGPGNSRTAPPELFHRADEQQRWFGTILMDPNEIVRTDVVAPWIPRVHELIVSARQQLSQLEKVQVIRKFDPEEVPEEYRRDVRAYFDRLNEMTIRKGDDQ